ncbi:MAG: hypothetical protein Q8M03_13910 [Legionella sp.]|nr:hypothetical protein [Legionella sp.]
MNNYTNAAVVAHDAGAANHIISWLRTGLIDSKSAFFCFAGPAEVIALAFFPELQNHSLDDALNNASILISGTGWQTELEHNARILARANNLKTVGVIDHWVNYQARFIRNNAEILPDEIWVVDDYAKKIAETSFPTTAIIKQPNDYLTFELQTIKSFTKSRTGFTRVLFLMEPIREKWGSTTTLGEIQAFNYFIRHVNVLNLSNMELVIKPHPSDNIGKYQSLINTHRALAIKIDDESTLAELLGWADIVVGCQTYAMAIATAAGKTVVSTLPPQASPCVLPHQEIIHLSKLVVEHELL